MSGYKILVTGGSGFLGQAIVKELLGENAVLPIAELRIFALKEYSGIEDQRIKPIQGDIRNWNLVNEACKGVDAVIHSAALVDWGIKRPEEIYVVNFNGTENVLNACQENGVKALVSTSTVDAVYTGKPLRDIDETISYPARYSNMYGQSKSEAEQLILRSNNDDLRTAAIRPADIWGEGDPYHLKALFNMADSGFYVRLGNGKAKCQHVYVGNCAHAHVLVAQALLEDNPKVGGQAYFITDGPAENFFTFFDRIVLACGYKIWPRNLWLPKSLAYIIGAISEFVSIMVRPIKYYNPSFSRFAVNYTCTDLTFNSNKAQDHFEFCVKYSPDMAMERTSAYYRNKNNQN